MSVSTISLALYPGVIQCASPTLRLSIVLLWVTQRSAFRVHLYLAEVQLAPVPLPDGAVVTEDKISRTMPPTMTGSHLAVESVLAVGEDRVDMKARATVTLEVVVTHQITATDLVEVDLRAVAMGRTEVASLILVAGLLNEHALSAGVGPGSRTKTTLVDDLISISATMTGTALAGHRRLEVVVVVVVVEIREMIEVEVDENVMSGTMTTGAGDTQITVAAAEKEGAAHARAKVVMVARNEGRRHWRLGSSLGGRMTNLRRGIKEVTCRY